MNQSKDLRGPSARMRVTAAILGNALEFYDFTVYAAFATWLAKAFFPTDNPKSGCCSPWQLSASGSWLVRSAPF